MLNPSKLRHSFDKIISGLKKRYLIISTATLITLSSFVPRISDAIDSNIIIKFRDLAKQATVLIDNSRVINSDGSVSYNVPEKSKKDLDDRFKDLIKEIEKQVDRDIKNQVWSDAERVVWMFYDFLHQFGGFDESANKLYELAQYIHKDFVSHVNLKLPGVYTLKGSGKIYVISNGSSRDMNSAMNKSGNNTLSILLAYLSQGNTIQATVSGFGQTIANDIKAVGNGFEVNSLSIALNDFKVVLEDGTKLSERDIAARLESEHRFLPLK